MQTKECIWCKALVKGRSDKKFCNDYCRSAYHYKQRDQKSELVKNVIRQLERNRALLEKWKDKKIREIDLRVARREGFSEDVFTGIETRKGRRWRLVFDGAFLCEGRRVRV